MQVCLWGGWRGESDCSAAGGEVRLGDFTLPEAPDRERKARSSQESCLCFSGIAFL